MTLCDDGHQEICFEGRTCPACTLKNESMELEDQVEDLKQQLKEAIKAAQQTEAK